MIWTIVTPIALRRLAGCFGICASLALMTAGPSSAARPIAYTIHTMGTNATVTIVARDSLETLSTARDALARFSFVDRLLSNWNPKSELSRLNAVLGDQPVELSSDAAMVVGAALRISEQSAGAFDPTVEPLVRAWGFLGGTPRWPEPEQLEDALARVGYQKLRLERDNWLSAAPGVRIDLGGIAKGHAVDLAAAALRDAGVENALIDLSGNMIAIGHPIHRAHWTVGVRDPATANDWFATLELGPEAIATSGNYEQFIDHDGRRYGHVLDPRNGWPVDELVSATVLAPTALEADAWATALLVLGTERTVALISARDDLSCIVVQKQRDGRFHVWVEASLRDRFDLVTGSRGRFELHWF